MEWHRSRGTFSLGIGIQQMYGFSYLHISLGPGYLTFRLPFGGL